MPIYVDALFTLPSRDPEARCVGRRHNHRWCHMWTEPGNEAELHAMARAIGMRREWCQEHKPTFIHYDLVPTRRAAALRRGAVEMDLREWLRARRQHAEHL